MEREQSQSPENPYAAPSSNGQPEQRTADHDGGHYGGQYGGQYGGHQWQPTAVHADGKRPRSTVRVVFAVICFVLVGLLLMRRPKG